MTTSKYIPWLISEKQFDSLPANDIFVDNGITSPQWARHCLQYARFNGNVICPYCNSTTCYEMDTIFKCDYCLVKFSVTSRTFIDNTKLAAHYWWRFAYLVGAKQITNSVTIAADLQVTQKTAWLMLDTLRQARKSMFQFTTGTQVLSFSNADEVLHTLLITNQQLVNKK